MEAFTTLLVLLTKVLVCATNPTDIPSRSQDLVVATDEMARANYFSFVMLINMSPLDQKFQGNVTFLMPKDRILSKIRMHQHAVSDFLLRHSIPSPLLFDHLRHIPPGSLIPSSDPDYMLNIDNQGRKSFFLNNVKISSPDLCTAGSSIRCHGIDGVLVATERHPLPACSNSTSPAVVATPPSPSLPLPDIPSFPSSAPPPGAAAPTDQEHNPKHSGSSQLESLSLGGLLKFLATSILVLNARVLYAVRLN
ncbi:PREDICTED: FAS1 domain-containing protein SELMODRAFT_448915 [Populus euphratica]|uniref:FAS1 domain-containing protein SELMODRAFT_448915 n=1 Tax=Populus euphratica TaxID=75702 RepID=A0AAJ6T8B2_POPEU|nr:PREDICTED: FAS1 domain-containing protein SELMODRAFT_448915 [Populus euphratica]